MEDMISQKLKKIIFDVLEPDIREEQITPEAKFVDDLGAQSLDIVEILMAVEEQFNLDIPDSDAEKIVTVQDAENCIRGRPPGQNKEKTTYGNLVDFTSI